MAKILSLTLQIIFQAVQPCRLYSPPSSPGQPDAERQLLPLVRLLRHQRHRRLPHLRQSEMDK